MNVILPNHLTNSVNQLMCSESHHCDVSSSQAIEILIKTKGKNFSNLGCPVGGRLCITCLHWNLGPRDQVQGSWERHLKRR